MDQDGQDTRPSSHLTTGTRSCTIRWNEELFPDHVAFLKKLHDRKFKVTLNTHPADGVRACEKPYAEMAKAMGRDPSDGQVSLCPIRSPAQARTG